MTDEEGGVVAQAAGSEGASFCTACGSDAAVVECSDVRAARARAVFSTTETGGGPGGGRAGGRRVEGEIDT